MICMETSFAYNANSATFHYLYLLWGISCPIQGLFGVYFQVLFGKWTCQNWLEVWWAISSLCRCTPKQKETANAENYNPKIKHPTKLWGSRIMACQLCNVWMQKVYLFHSQFTTFCFSSSTWFSSLTSYFTTSKGTLILIQTWLFMISASFKENTFCRWVREASQSTNPENNICGHSLRSSAAAIDLSIFPPKSQRGVLLVLIAVPSLALQHNPQARERSHLSGWGMSSI